MNAILHNRKIIILKNGPYRVIGDIPLMEEIMIIGEDKEPEGWATGRAFPHATEYALCRCGATKTNPFCDGSHLQIGFDGTESAGHENYLSRAERTIGPEIELTWSEDFCAVARFCHHAGGAWTLAERSDIPSCREKAVQESIDCPSGALVAWERKSGEAIEPDFAPSIGLIENRQSGLSGPIWVKGGIPIESSDGTLYEIRNRVTLCRCGASKKKPFCDGTHNHIGFKSRR
jgi:CDGSH-type Zn-finger protein